MPHSKPSFPFGSFKATFTQQLSFAEQLDILYRSSSEAVIGVFAIFRPTLIIRDANLVRNILTKDFEHFVDRGVYVNEKSEPLSAHLFALEGAKWKNVRIKLTPTFTTGKMRTIFTTLLSCKNPLQKYLKKIAQAGETIDVREVSTGFTTNAIASIAFGIDVNCFADPDNPIRKYGRQVFERNVKNAFRLFCFSLCPKLVDWTRIGLIDREVEAFFLNMVQQTLELREKYDISRNDFFELLMQLQKTGSVQLNDEWHTMITNGNCKHLTMDEITAQAFVFFVAGIETSSMAMSFCLYEIAKNAEIQDHVHKEIDAVLAQHNGQFTYESIQQLTYLESCIDGKFWNFYFQRKHLILFFCFVL